MTYDPNDFVTREKPMKNIIKTASGEEIKVKGVGTISLARELTLKNFLFVPNLSHKLLSISQLKRDLNCIVLLKPSCYIVQNAQTGQTIGRGIEKGGLYYLEEEVQKGKAVLVHGSKEKQFRTWHRRLGHPSIGYLEKLFPNLARNRFDFKCETCILAKSHKNSYPSSINKTKFSFLLIHSDVWGPTPVVGLHGYLYYVVFIDDCTRMSWIYFLKHKSEVFKVFIDFYNMICTQFQAQSHIFELIMVENMLILICINFSPLRA